MITIVSQVEFIEFLFINKYIIIANIICIEEDSKMTKNDINYILNSFII